MSHGRSGYAESPMIKGRIPFLTSPQSSCPFSNFFYGRRIGKDRCLIDAARPANIYISEKIVMVDDSL